MASIRTIAQQVLEEARDGIAWIALYKEGRSWNAACFWPDYDEGHGFTFEPDDLKEVREILSVDPNAIFVNGYYCNLGPVDKMTRESLAATLRWQYENRFCPLADEVPDDAGTEEEEAGTEEDGPEPARKRPERQDPWPSLSELLNDIFAGMPWAALVALHQPRTERSSWDSPQLKTGPP